MEDIRSFEQKYKGSEEEEEDLKAAYLRHEGDMDRIMEEVREGEEERGGHGRGRIIHPSFIREVKYHCINFSSGLMDLEFQIFPMTLGNPECQSSL